MTRSGIAYVGVKSLPPTSAAYGIQWTNFVVDCIIPASCTMIVKFYEGNTPNTNIVDGTATALLTSTISPNYHLNTETISLSSISLHSSLKYSITLNSPGGLVQPMFDYTSVDLNYRISSWGIYTRYADIDFSTPCIFVDFVYGVEEPIGISRKAKYRGESSYGSTIPIQIQAHFLYPVSYQSMYQNTTPTTNDDELAIESKIDTLLSYIFANDVTIRRSGYSPIVVESISNLDLLEPRQCYRKILGLRTKFNIVY